MGNRSSEPKRFGTDPTEAQTDATGWERPVKCASDDSHSFSLIFGPHACGWSIQLRVLGHSLVHGQLGGKNRVHEHVVKLLFDPLNPLSVFLGS